MRPIRRWPWGWTVRLPFGYLTIVTGPLVVAVVYGRVIKDRPEGHRERP